MFNSPRSIGAGLDEAREQTTMRCSVLKQELGMPLHADDEGLISALHSFHNTVLGPPHRLKRWRKRLDGLVVT